MSNNETIDFAAFDDIDTSDIVMPPALPKGLYALRVAELPKLEVITSGKSGEQWDKASFRCEVVEALDVDPEDIQKYREEVGEVTGKQIIYQFMLTKAEGKKGDRQVTLVRLKNFLTKSLGLEDGKLGQVLQSAVDARFKAKLDKKPNKQDPTIEETVIAQTSALD